MSFANKLLPLILVTTACGDDIGTDTPDAPPTPDSATPDAPTPQAITLPFAAKVDGTPFACGQSYANIGSTDATYVGIDFRFFVHGVRVVTTNGDVPVTLDVDAFQTADGIALLDFETGGSACQMGSTATHTALTGTVPAGTTFTGVKFTVGVPFAKNHLDATLATAPMNIPAMYWAWSSGYKFIKADGTVNGAGFNVHLGSTACGVMGTNPPTSPCANPNTFEVTLTGFTPGTSEIVADIGRVIADVDLTVNTQGTAPGCMSFPNDPQCDTILPKLGLAYGTNPAQAQQLFTVE